MELKAKKVSLIAKIASGIILIAGAILKWTGIFTHCEIPEICAVCGTLVGLFLPVDTNIALDKFAGKEQGE